MYLRDLFRCLVETFFYLLPGLVVGSFADLPCVVESGPLISEIFLLPRSGALFSLELSN